MISVPRKAWFRLHSWVGLKLSIMLFFIFATGTLAVLAHEIDWLLNPAMRVTVEESRASWGEQLRAVHERHPDWRVEFLFAPVDPWFATAMYAVTPEGRRRHVYVNPYTAEVTGDTRWFNAHRFLREVHRHLMLPVKYGVPIVSAFAFALVVTLISSFWVYRKWWRGFIAWPRRDRSRRFWGDLHRLAGVWSLWFVFLMAVTGIWYLVESLGANAPPAVVFAGDANVPPPVVTGIQLDRMIAAAESSYPELSIEHIRLPTRGGQPVMLQGQADAILVRPRANTIAFDPVSGEEIHRHYGGDLTLHQRISEAADPLHFGTFGGLPTKIIWFVFGALMTTLSVTGIYLYGLRVAGGRSTAASRWHEAWHGIAHWRLPGIVMLLTVMLLLPGAVAR